MYLLQVVLKPVSPHVQCAAADCPCASHLICDQSVLSRVWVQCRGLVDAHTATEKDSWGFFRNALKICE